MPRPAILVTTYEGHPSVDEMEREAREGRRPRKDYVELARRTGAVVIDHEHLVGRGHPAAQRIAARAGIPAGQVAEAFLRRAEFDGVLAWADRLGLPLALLKKLTRGPADQALVSVALSSPRKALPMRILRLHTHFSSIMTMGSVQLEIAASRLGVPRDKLVLGLQPVDEQFFAPRNGAPAADGPVVAVGWEARDYPTLLRAARELDVPFELAIGSIAARDENGVPVPELGELPPNVRLLLNLSPAELREVYGRSRMVVVPLRDVEFDAGVTVITEAMAMGKPVVVTRTRGQVDVVREGVEGRYVPPGDPRALREAIQALVDDSALAERMGRAGRELVERERRLDQYVAQLADLLEQARRAPQG